MASSDYVCTLSEELIQKAEEELNEKAQWRSRDIQALRDMLEKKTELRIRLDDAYLLRYLRAKKFDYDRAFNLIIRHFQMKADPKNASLFRNLTPSAVKHVLDAGVTGVLPQRDKLGRRVLLFRPGKWDPSKYPIDDIFRANFLCISKLVEEDETQAMGVILIVDMESMGLGKQDVGNNEDETQVTGVILIVDMESMGLTQATGFSPFYAKKISGLLQDEEAQINGIVLLTDLKSMGWKHTRKFKPLFAKRAIGLLQDCFPMRFKGIHYVNEPSVFDYIFAIVKPFMKEKILNRIHFHGTKYHELAEYMDPAFLPAEYGGQQPPFTNEDWTKTLLDSEATFKEEERYGFVKAIKKPETTCRDDTLDCLAGSYRNLET